jgi:hypothetical protein
MELVHRGIKTLRDFFQGKSDNTPPRPPPYSGSVTHHTSSDIRGMCRDEAEPDKPVKLDLFWGDMRLRTVVSERGQFKFGFDPSFTDLLPVNTFLALKFPTGETLDRICNAPIGTATDCGAKLRTMLSNGYVLDKWGGLKLPFSAKSAEQRAAYAQSMCDVTHYFEDKFGVTLFPAYGSLLGYARSKSFIPHDDDTDMSYVSNASTIEEAVHHFFDMMDVIKADGHNLWIVDAGQASVSLKYGGGTGTDIFTSRHESSGRFFTYFGVLGQIGKPLTFTPDLLENSRVNIPDNYEEILEITYGPTWRTPDPDFAWSQPRALAEMVLSFQKAGQARLQAFR